LAFTRHYMASLAQIRDDKVIDMPVIESN